MAAPVVASPVSVHFQNAPDCREKIICDTRPICPACGGLECLCRPRFFAGQLLTEDDLNRLERYVIDKNKLHNRHLFGSGVACGLEVVCAACDADSIHKVVVRPGYALSPCGNDIVVCRQETVDVCDLISRCRLPSADECLDPNATPVLECVDAEEDWVLAVCYDEKPSRGVVALRGSGATPSCGCGGGGCGCGCGGGCGCQNIAAAYAPKPSTAPTFTAAQCEPTLICEGYRFTAHRAATRTNKAPQFGDIVVRFWCCLAPMLEELAQFPLQGATQEELLKWYLQFKQTIREFIISQGLYDCEVVQIFATISDPQIGQRNLNDYLVVWRDAVWSIAAIPVAIFLKCLCSAMLPPCPPMALSDCVPIATVTVRRNPCRVTQVCNISARSFLFTMPNLEYWLGWIPLLFNNGQGPTLRDFLEGMCCKPVDNAMRDYRTLGVQLERPLTTEARPMRASGDGAPAGAVPSAAAGSPFGDLLWNAIFDPQARMNVPRFLLGAMGATDANGQPLVTEQHLAQPAAALLLGQVVGPLLSMLVPSAQSQRGAPGAGPSGPSGAGPGSGGPQPGGVPPEPAVEEITRLSQTVAELQATIKNQQRDINRLKKK